MLTLTLKSILNLRYQLLTSRQFRVRAIVLIEVQSETEEPKALLCVAVQLPHGLFNHVLPEVRNHQPYSYLHVLMPYCEIVGSYSISVIFAYIPYCARGHWEFTGQKSECKCSCTSDARSPRSNWSTKFISQNTLGARFAKMFALWKFGAIQYILAQKALHVGIDEDTCTYFVYQWAKHFFPPAWRWS